MAFTRLQTIERATRWWLKMQCEEFPEYVMENHGGRRLAHGATSNTQVHGVYQVRWVNPKTGLYEDVVGKTLDPVIAMVKAWKHHCQLIPKPIHMKPGRPYARPPVAFKIGGKIIVNPNRIAEAKTILLPDKPKDKNETNKTAIPTRPSGDNS